MQAETLHLTVAFLGNTPAAQVRDLALQASQWPVAVGTIALERFGRFVGPGVVWAGPADQGSCVTWLDALYDGLWGRLQAMGWQKPESAFRPHVSLLRKAGPGDISQLHRPPLVWAPSQCVLVASRPREGGSYYEVLARMPMVSAAC